MEQGMNNNCCWKITDTFFYCILSANLKFLSQNCNFILGLPNHCLNSEYPGSAKHIILIVLCVFRAVLSKLLSNLWERADCRESIIKLCGTEKFQVSYNIKSIFVCREWYFIDLIINHAFYVNFFIFRFCVYLT